MYDVATPLAVVPLLSAFHSRLSSSSPASSVLVFFLFTFPSFFSSKSRFSMCPIHFLYLFLILCIKALVLGAVHKVRHAIFGQILPSPCHTLSHIPGPPRKYVTHLGPPRFLVGLVQKSWTKVPCTNSISIVPGGFCRGVCQGWFLSVPPSVTIHMLQQKVIHHFKFHVSYVL